MAYLPKQPQLLLLIIAMYMPTNMPLKCHICQLVHTPTWNFVTTYILHMTSFKPQCDQTHWYTYISHYWHMPLNNYACHIGYMCPTALLQYSVCRVHINISQKKDHGTELILPKISINSLWYLWIPGQWAKTFYPQSNIWTSRTISRHLVNFTDLYECYILSFLSYLWSLEYSFSDRHICCYNAYQVWSDT